jgi:hypothetical protein
MPKYASQTQVPVERSRGEIERTLVRYGAEQFVYGWDRAGAVIGFIVTTESGQKRQVRFQLPLPDRADPEFTTYKRGYSTYERTAVQAEKLYEQAGRQRWRALALVVKAKLEAVEAGIATFEDEFLAYTMLPGGETVGQWLTPQLDRVYELDKMPPMLPAGDPIEDAEIVEEPT